MHARLTLPVTAALACLATACATATPGRTHDDSPTAAVVDFRDIVREASTLEAVQPHLPTEWRARVEQVAPDERARALDQLKAQVAGLEPGEERIRGDRAAALAYDSGGRGGLIFLLERGEDGWQLVEGEPADGVVRGARGSFTVSGGREYAVPDEPVRVDEFEGAPIIVIYDMFAHALNGSRWLSVPTLTLPVPECLEPGTHTLEPVEPHGYTADLSAPDADGDGNHEAFSGGADYRGSLVVEAVDAGRFDARFTAGLVDHEGRRVQARGRIVGAPVVCDGG